MSVATLARIDSENLLAEMRSMMTKYHIKQRQLAEVSGYDHSTISRVLDGTRNPRLETMIVLCAALMRIERRAAR